jgi:hypothetical protein
MRKWIAVAALTLLPAAASAQAWEQAPDGSWIYHTNYSTTGLFGCIRPENYLGTCSASGNQITFGTGGAFMTLTFIGTGPTALNVHGPGAPVYIGTIAKSFSGTGPFSFAGVLSDQAPVFGLAFLISSTDPVVTAGGRQFQYRFVSGQPVVNNCCNSTPYATLRLAPLPPGAHFDALQFFDFSNPAITVTPEALQFSALVHLTPEPSTYALMAAGLLALGVVARRRRRA